jgi:hypothetical protein
MRVDQITDALYCARLYEADAERLADAYEQEADPFSVDAASARIAAKRALEFYARSVAELLSELLR